MAPFLRDDGPPVSKETIREARETLPREYGYTLVNETGRPTLLVRCPRPEPDYNHELADAALYVGLDELKDVTDVLLVGDERTTRMEPLRLRDHIRERIREDREITAEVAPKLPREYGYTVLTSEVNPNHTALALRVPRASVSEFCPEDVKHIRQNLRGNLLEHVQNCNLAYVIADEDYERVGHRVFLELLQVEAEVEDAPAAPATAPAAEPAPEPAPAARNTVVDAEEYVKVAPKPPQPAKAISKPAAPVKPETPAARPEPTPAPAAEAPASAGPAKLPPGVKPGSPQARALELGGPSREFATEVETEEYEVIVSKPKADEGPRDDPRTRPVSTPPKTPSQDNGASVEPKVEVHRDPNADLETLADRFELMEYEIMRDVPVMGHTFEVAAHRHGGKRVLAKRIEAFAEADCVEYQRLAEDLGADVCVLIADRIEPGARLATWGTRVLVLAEGEADRVEF